MSRKRVSKEEPRRRSPRLWAWKMQPAPPKVPKSCDNSEQKQGPPPPSTWAHKKTRFNPVEDVGGESSNHKEQPVSNVKQLVLQTKEAPIGNDHGASNGQKSTPSYAAQMPAKPILELILDTLQKRDTYEIFAEPVDPNEVEDYYKIVEEPMDFGTMRAKLHEGLYTTFEQFKHDVFLITKNAMNFNASRTVYFRQARAIHELAKKVFQVLKTNPKNFESEFAATRQRPGRRPLVGAKVPCRSSVPKFSANVRPTAVHISSKDRPPSYPLNDPSKSSRSIGIAGRRISCLEADRRSTYRPLSCIWTKNDSGVSTINSYQKELMHMNEGSIGYRESLMLFVKDLGPVAKAVANRKLQELCGNPPTSATYSTRRDLSGEVEHALLVREEEDHTIGEFMKDFGIYGGDSARQKQINDISLDLNSASVDSLIDLNLPLYGIESTTDQVGRSSITAVEKKMPTELPSWKSFAFEDGKKKSPIPSPAFGQLNEAHVGSPVNTSMGAPAGFSSWAVQVSESKKRDIENGYTFDLRFVKSQLSRMKASS